MSLCPIPANESERLDSLYSLNILDSNDDPQFNFVVEYIANSLSTPIALASFVDKDRIWFKSTYGVPAQQFPRNMSICGHSITSITSTDPFQRIIEINNLLDDSRFSANPFVQNYPKVRSYLGFMLQSQCNKNIGSLCVIDTKPRVFSPDEKEQLVSMGLVLNNLALAYSEIRS